MRGYSVVTLAGLWLTLCAPAVCGAAPLKIRPLVTPQEYARLGERERQSHAPIDPALARHLAARTQRWNNFRDDISAAGFNRSPFARLRKGATVPERRRPGELATKGALGGPVRTIRVAFIRIDFLNDRDGGKSSGNGKFDLSGPDTLAPPIDRPPHNRSFYEAHVEALSRYYDVQSYGRIRVEGEVWPREQNGAYSLPDMADLGPWRFSQDIYPAARDMFRAMILAADSQSIVRGERIPWLSYDRYVLIHAGSDLQNDVRQDSPLDIPSFTIGVIDTDAVVFKDSSNVDQPIDRASIVPETNNQDGFYGAINGVIAHECGHLMFGFVDVYDVHSGLPVVGFWSLMDYGNGVGAIVQTPTREEIFATGFLAPSIDPWHRFRFMLGDQLPMPEMPYGDTISIRSSERHPDVHRVTLSSDEYLILENRYLTPTDSIQVDQDDSTRVVLGPKKPDRFEVDALLPGGGILVWHVDESKFPFEFSFPIDTSLRVNPDFGLNSDPRRRGLQLIEADALADLGDPGSPYLLGAPFDPYFRTNNPSLSDSTRPNLISNSGTRPHTRLDFLSEPDSAMDVGAARVWQLAGWPVAADFPPGGPVLLAVDADGDRLLEACWAGGADSILVDLAGETVRVPNPDSAALFAVRLNGNGLRGRVLPFARLDRRPRPEMAALPTGEDTGGGVPPQGPSYFAVSTYPAGSDTSQAGGRVWLIDGSPANLGRPLPGWPPPLPSIVRTPPVIAEGTIYVGCADGRVYALRLDGTVSGVTDPPLPGGIVGRLAVITSGALTASGTDPGRGVGAREEPGGTILTTAVAAAGDSGDIAVFGVGTYRPLPGWPRRVASVNGSVGPAFGLHGFNPEFLWIDFGGAANTTADCHRGALSLVVHHADWMWAFCASTAEQLPGWGRDVGDTLVQGLGAGDPDGDGFPEVLTHSVRSQVAFWNVTGYPSPGWPRRGTPEEFPRRFDEIGDLVVERRLTESPAVAADVDGDGNSEVIALNVSGIITALRADGKKPPGWPLSAGLGAAGAPVVADFDRNGSHELIAPDRLGNLFGYTIPHPASRTRPIEWPMLGGDPGRTAALRLDPSLYPPAPSAAPGPLVSGSLMAYPNPARRHPVSFAYRLTEPARVEFRILDASGHEVASFSRDGRQADNLEVWDPAGLPAGLYLARLRFHGAGTERIEVVPLGVLR